MKFRLSLTTILIFFITTFFSSASNVGVSWNASCNTNVTGYKVYFGASTTLLTPSVNGTTTDCNGNTLTNLTYPINFTNYVNVGNVTSATISNLQKGYYYYFAATSYDVSGNESGFSSEVVYDLTDTNKYTYVGVKVDYGTSLTTLSSQSVMVLTITNDPGYFYSESLILTNNPFIGTNPNDGNRHVYVGTLIKYGQNLTSLNYYTSPVFTLTNPPSNYYRSSLILTNHAF